MSDLAERSDDVPTPVAGPHRPVVETPEAAPDSVRRTTSFDMTRPEGLDGPLVADVRGRDLRCTPEGAAVILDAVDLQVEIDQATTQVVSLSGSSATSEVRGLEGVSLRGGFAAAVADALRGDRSRRTLLYSALEDLSGANLVSGYARLQAGAIPVMPEFGEAMADRQRDVCAGWADGGAVVEHLRLTGENAVPMGPPAPALVTGDGRWHALAPIAPHTVRRLRCLDVRVPHLDGGRPTVWAHFRDSHRRVDRESVMHEYVVTGDVDPVGTTIEHLKVDVRVLPWDTCPAAADGAPALDGTPARELPARVRAELRGPTTCTHLNSTIRSLADVDALLRVLDAGEGA